MAVSDSDLGDELRAQGHYPEAIAHYRAALQTFERIAAGDPTNPSLRLNSSIALNRIAVAQEAQGDLSGALLSHREALRIDQALANANPPNARARAHVATDLANIRRLQERMGLAPDTEPPK
jgi:tetratricopeptide (TPR) repeat protein